MADTVTTQSSAPATPPAGTVIATDDAGASGQVQIVKLALSADGSASPISADSSGLLVNTELPAAAVPDDAETNTAAPATYARGLVYSGVDGQWKKARAADGDALNPKTVPAIAVGGYNGATIDRMRGSIANGLAVDVTRVSGTVAVNNSQIAGTTMDTNSGVKSAGTQRVVLATDQPALTTPMPVDTELPAAALLADAAALPTSPPQYAVSQVYNGATLDMLRGNVEATALASAARTATTSSANLTNHSSRGIVIFLNVSASAAGTGGLQVQVFGVDPISGNAVAISAAPTAVTAVATRVYVIYPGISTGGTQAISTTFPRTFLLRVTPGDSTSYTYSVSYCLID